MPTPQRKPGKSDASRPRLDGDYAYKREFYRSPDVAADYDFHRLGSPARRRRHARVWSRIARALDVAGDVRSVLDLPCGTGRFVGHLADRGCEVIGGDISMEMMQKARERHGGNDRVAGFVQAAAEALPLRGACVDCVMSIRFLHHVDPPRRVGMLREMARVSRRWLVVDYRHRRSLRYASWRLRRAVGLVRHPLPRVSRAELERELGEAGLTLVRVFAVAPIFSDKWIVLCRTRGVDA